MKKLKSDGEAPDRLSELPKSLILLILSFVGMIDVVRTTLLSKSWKYLWTTIPCLKFFPIKSCPVRTRSFVNRCLMLWKGFKIRRFEIRFEDGFDSSSYGDMDLWVLFAKERDVDELFIRLPTYSAYMLPECIIECSSIRTLKLYCCELRIRGNVQWDQLTNLGICGSCWTEDMINQVVSSSPRLETLRLIFLLSSPNVSVRSSTLKWLMIVGACSSLSNYTVTIWAPNLEVLNFETTPYSKYFLTNVSSLTKAKLGFVDTFGADVGEPMSQILPSIRHVETLELSACCFQMLGAIKGKCSFSPLLNVKLLTIIGRLIEPNKIVGLLENFPKLKRLVIDWKLDPGEQEIIEPLKFDAENYIASEAKSFLLLLKTVHITLHSYEASFFQFVEHLLKHAAMIEKVVIKNQECLMLVPDAEQNMLSLLRSFPTVELEFLH